MAYATVMVGLSVGQPNEARLQIAGQLAERLGARVIGIAAAEFNPPLYFTCVYRKLDSAILVVKATKNWV